MGYCSEKSAVQVAIALKVWRKVEGGREELKSKTAVAVDAVVSCTLEVWHSCFMVVGVVGVQKSGMARVG